MLPVLSICTTLIGCCFAVIFLELLVREDPGCGHLVTLSAFVFISAEGFVNGLKFGRKSLVVPVTEWLRLVLIFFIVNVINNYSFSYNIPMPLYMIFKSGSLAASLITEKLVMGRKHSRSKHMAVILMTFGIMLCTYASSKQINPLDVSTHDWMVGIALLSTSLLLSARMGIYQEQIYAKWGKHHQEALFFIHFLPLPAFVVLAHDIQTHFQIALHSVPTWTAGLPIMFVYLLGYILSQYLCSRSVFWLSSNYSSLTITMILTLRKFLSILISVCLFGNVFSNWHWIGTCLIFIGTFLFSNDRIKIDAKKAD